MKFFRLLNMDLFRLGMALSAFFALTITTLAQGEALDLSQATFAGSGCDLNSKTEVFYDEWAQELRVRLDSMHIEGGQGAIVRKSCSLSVPIALPVGYKLIFGEANLRGRAKLTKGAQVFVHSESFRAGDADVRSELELVAPSEGLNRFWQLSSSTWSETLCGENLNLRWNVSLRGQRLAPGDLALSHVMSLKAQLVACD